jgi:hypothetical protein
MIVVIVVIVVVIVVECHDCRHKLFSIYSHLTSICQNFIHFVSIKNPAATYLVRWYSKSATIYQKDSAFGIIADSISQFITKLSKNRQNASFSRLC